MSKIVYKAASNVDFFISLLLRFSCIAAIVFLRFKYDQNPPVIIVLAILCLVFFLLIGNDEITVYSDKIVHADTSILQFLLKAKKSAYQIKDIKRVFVPKPEKSDTTEVVTSLVLAALLPKQRRLRNNPNTINLELKNGNTATIQTYLGTKKVEKIVAAINSIV